MKPIGMPRGRKKGSGKREKAIVVQAHAFSGEIRRLYFGQQNTFLVR
jgi:hypothetical protein